MDKTSLFIGFCLCTLVGLIAWGIWADGQPARLNAQYRYRVELPTTTYWCDYYEVEPNGIILLPDTVRIIGSYSILRNK